MASPLRTLVMDFGWVHSGLGNFGNISFFVGSILFLPRFEAIQIWGVWLFIVGAFFMMIGSMGNLLIKIYEAREGSTSRTGGDGSRRRHSA